MKPILIAGPTASGKTALALQLAQRFNGIIVNADSMQIYADLRIITARPSLIEEQGAPHMLYGYVDGSEAYSVGRWLDDVKDLLDNYADKRLIFVGGTGLYFDGLTQGIAPIPAVAEEIRRYWRDKALNEGAGELHAQLQTRDPEMASRLKPTDLQRIARALEVFDSTGRSLSYWQQNVSIPLLGDGHYDGIVLTPDRSWLRQRIAQRFRLMVEEGGFEEIKALNARQLDPVLPVMKSLGVPPLLAVVREDITLEEAIRQSILDTGRYAKRQDTWFRNRMAGWVRVENTAIALKKCENL